MDYDSTRLRQAEAIIQNSLKGESMNPFYSTITCFTLNDTI